MQGSQKAMAGQSPYHARRGKRHAIPPSNNLNAELRETVRRSPYRSVLPPRPCALQDAPPAAAFIVLVEGEAITPDAVYGAADEIERAHALDRSALILGHDKAQRDRFRDDVMALLHKRRAARRAAVVGWA